MVQLQKEVSQLTQPTQTNIIHILIKETRNSNVFFLKFLFRLTCLCLKQIHRCQCSVSTNKLMVQYTFISSCIPWLSNPCVLYCSAMLYCNVHHAVCFYCLLYVLYFLSLVFLIELFQVETLFDVTDVLIYY